MAARVAFSPPVAAVMAALPAKLVDIGGAAPVAAWEETLDDDAASVNARVERIRAALSDPTKTHFMDHEGLDRALVVSLWREFVNAMQIALTDAALSLCDNSGVYEGERGEDGLREGHGIARFPTGDVYEGEWKDNKCEGRGRELYAEGDTYEGEWKAGRYEGKGIYRFADGAQFEGEWEDDAKCGRGKMRYESGAWYTGEWADDEFHGAGKMRYAQGALYDGEWKRGRRDGHGTFRVGRSGAVFTGEWKDDRMEGRGRMYYASGGRYDGEYVADVREGRGCFRWVDGEAQLCVYRSGKPTGDGALWSADRRQAWQLIDGEPHAAISLERARELAALVGMPEPSPSS
jgi:hypothetical protein